MTAARRSWPWLLGLVVLAIYTTTFGRIHTWDAMAYAARAAGNPLVSERFLSTTFWHPHHLLYMALASGWLRALGTLGDSDPTGLGSLQLLSALFGAGAVVLTALIVRRTSGSDFRALVAALGAGLSSALWRYSTAVEVMTASLFFLLLGAYLLLDRKRTSRGILAGVSLAAAILLHQIAVFFVAAFLAALFPRSLHHRGERKFLWAAALLAAGLVVGIYLAVGRAGAGITTASGFADWMTRVRERARFEATPLVRTLVFTARTMVAAFVSPEPLVALRHQGMSAWAVAGSALSLFAGGGLAAVAFRLRRGARTASPGDAPWFLGLVLGGVLTALFIAWFEPLNLEYAVYLVPFVWIGIAGGAPALRTGRLVPAAALLALAAANLAGSILPERNAGNAPYRDLQAFAGETLRPGDVFILGRDDGSMQMALMVFPLMSGTRTLAYPAGAPPAAEARYREEIRRALPSPGRPGPRVFGLREALPEARAASPVPLSANPVGRLRGKTVVELLARPRVIH